VLIGGLPGLLALLADVLTGASYPKREVVGERDRLVQELAIYRSQAAVVAREALLHRLYGDHPYGRELPTAEQVEEVKAASLRTLHARRVVPAGSILTVVGDLAPARLLGLVEQALGGWTATGRAHDTPPVRRSAATRRSQPIAAGSAPCAADAPAKLAWSACAGGVALQHVAERLERARPQPRTPTTRTFRSKRARWLSQNVTGSTEGVGQAERSQEVGRPRRRR